MRCVHEERTAMARKLKVFCTAIGFHDAYVAAPSMKAALEAWGADVSLFAAGHRPQADGRAARRARQGHQASAGQHGRASGGTAQDGG
jgi:hypothetical protein